MISLGLDIEIDKKSSLNPSLFKDLKEKEEQAKESSSLFSYIEMQQYPLFPLIFVSRIPLE